MELKHNRNRVLSVKVAMEEWKIVNPQSDEEATLWFKKIISKQSYLKCLRYMYEYEESLFEHCMRVCFYAILLSRKLSLSRSVTATFAEAALLHDLGKTKIPKCVLQKNGRLADDEYFLVKQHVLYSCLLLEQEEISGMMIKVVLQHHEKIDGTGYPLSLSKEEISVLGRYLAVVDIYDAVHSSRCYKAGMSKEETLKVMWSQVGVDELILQLFIDVLEEAKLK